MNSSPGAKTAFVRWRIVLLLAGFAFLAHFNRISVTVAGNEAFIGPGRLDAEQMGQVYSAFLFIYTIGMLPGGWLIDRIGPRRALTVMGLGLGFWAAVTGGLGWSGLSIAALFVPLLVIRGLAGAASVPLHPAAARAVSLSMPLRERSTANGIITAGALLGIAFCYPIFGLFMTQIGWPDAFVMSGAILFVYTFLWHVLTRENAGNEGDEPTPSTSAGLREVIGLFGNSSLLLLTLSYGALSYVQYLFFYWIEYYFKNVLKVSPGASREAAMIITLAMAAGMFLGGGIADRIGRRLGHCWGCRVMAIAGMGLCAAFSLLGLSTANPWTVTTWFALALGALGACEAIFWTTAPLLERNGGLACALVNTGGNGVGMFAPLITPILGENYGWNSAIVAAGIICGIGGLLWLGINANE